MTDEQKRLVEQNIKLVWWYIRKHNLDPEEWLGPLSETLCKVAIKYDEDSGFKFSSYAKLAFDNCVMMWARERRAKKRIPDYMVVSGDKTIDPGGFDREASLFDIVESKKDEIGDMLFFYEMKRCLDRQKPRDREIWMMAMGGMNNTKIGAKMDLSHSMVNRILNRIRKEIKGEV